MRRLGAALILVLAGCASQRQEYAAAVAMGQARWQAACGVRPVPATVVVLDQATMRCGPLAPAAVGCTDADRHVFLAARATVPVAELVLHELGHVLGARHLTGSQHGVMTATLNDDRHRSCLTDDDLDATGVCTEYHPECQ